MSQADAVSRSGTELTVRALVLGALITLIFTAANVYLGLKVGLTFATSIPAAVISMAVLRAFKAGSIHENNIVQTVASAAGTLASIIFVLPGLVMVGWWTGFPFWMSFGICATGGILGVMYSIPLRRALVTNSDLPYPEGVAAAEVLKVGAGSREGAAEARSGLMSVLAGSIASALFAAITATKVFAAELAGYTRIGAGATGLSGGLSLALVGVGHLVGLSVGVAMLVGVAIAWGAATPILTAIQHTPGAAEAAASTVWRTQVRFIGAGAIAAAAVWSLTKLALPVWGGLVSAIRAQQARDALGGADLPRTERDIPIGIVGLISLATLIPVAGLSVAFLHGSPLQGMSIPLAIGAVLFVVVVGFLLAAVCGYMAGLIGASNSPVSGLGILSVVGAALLLAAFAGSAGPLARPALVAFALFVTAIVFSVATISNDNLQDLKTGQLVDATPWRQQVALIFGVVVGSLVIPPILSLLQQAYGFAGTPGLPHGGTSALPAPQATLISALAKGVIEGQLRWDLIGAGVVLGVVIVLIDETLGIAGKLRLPPLAVALGIYLPMATITPIVLGAVIGHGYDRWAERRSGNAEVAKRLGVLLSSGFIVGESLFGVTLAAIIVAAQRGWIPVANADEPLALVGKAFAGPSVAVGVVAFVAVVWGLYGYVRRLARSGSAPLPPA